MCKLFGQSCVRSFIYIISHVILTTLKGRTEKNHVLDDNIKAERLYNLPKVTELIPVRVGICDSKASKFNAFLKCTYSLLFLPCEL